MAAEQVTKWRRGGGSEKGMIGLRERRAEEEKGRHTCRRSSAASVVRSVRSFSKAACSRSPSATAACALATC